MEMIGRLRLSRMILTDELFGVNDIQVVIQLDGNTKIAQFHHIEITSNKNISGLDIPVEEVLRVVKVHQRCCNVTADL